MKIFTLSVLLLLYSLSFTQEEYKKKKLTKAELSLLFGYYEQEGDNSAVEGGIGTEELQNRASSIEVTLYWDSTKTLDVSAGLDIYSSASTDSIDFNNPSSASSTDYRGHGKIAYEQKINKNTALGVQGSYSLETDYQSFGLGINYNNYSKDENTILSVGAQLFLDQIDRWYGGKRKGIIYPIELRDTSWFDINRRNTYTLNFSFQQVINKRTNVMLATAPTLQEGLLSTPFHRTFFIEQTEAKVENLPRTRFKLPIALKANYFAWSFLITQWTYRFYYDDFGITSHTAQIRTPVKLIPFLTFYPSYRFYRQTKSNFFQPYKEHSLDQVYYTSDHDLSAFYSHQLGIGLRLSPYNGLIRSKSGKKALKSFSFEYLRYNRSTGLSAHQFSFSLDFIHQN